MQQNCFWLKQNHGGVYVGALEFEAVWTGCRTGFGPRFNLDARTCFKVGDCTRRL